MRDDVRGKRRCFFKTYARGMQGGLINVWILLRVCNVFTLSKVKSQRAVALGKFHSIDIVDGLPRGPEIQERVRRGLPQIPMSMVGGLRNAGRDGKILEQSVVWRYYT